jgi:hypothetical protein
MSKVIKLKQSDIENIVKNIIKEANEFDTQIGQEGLPGDNDPDINSLEDDDESTYKNPQTGEEYHEDPSKKSNIDTLIVVDPRTGTKYVIDNEKIVGISK